MGTVAICLVISLCLSFLYWKKSSSRKDFDRFNWGAFVIISVIWGLSMGFMVSVLIGNYISGEPVLTKVRALEPVVVGGERVFLIKKDPPPHYYFYFIKDGQQQIMKKISLKNLDFDDAREERIYRRMFKTPILKWFFFQGFEYTTEVVVSSKKDILNISNPSN